MRPGVPRLFLFLAGFVLFAIVLVVKLVDIQIVNHEFYSKIASGQHGFTTLIPAKRGTIFDRDLRPLAMTMPAFRVCADPSLIVNPTQVARVLADLLQVDRRALTRKLSDKESRYKVVSRAVDVEVGLAVKRLDLPGIYCEPAGRRVRPLGEVAQNVTGCLSEDDRPLAGIELVLDDELRGKPGLRRYLRDALGNPRPCIGAIVEMPVSGNSVILSIDADLQAIAEAALDAAVSEHRAKGGCVVVVDPDCGDVLALASNPRRENFPVRTVFEPGSALKICTFSAGLETGEVDDSDVFDTHGGVLKVPGGFIRDEHPRDILHLTEAFAISSNVVAAMIARRAGATDFYRYARAFGFGSKTGIGLGGESAGILRDPAEWSRRSLETLAIGQEIGVTALQLTMAYAAIANGGRLLRPTLVKAIIDEEGDVKHRNAAKTVRTVIREETALEMIRLLEAVVQGGTGTPAGIDGVHVAGKTGTGQKAECGRYIAGKFYSVFAGFAPASDARYVCVVVVDEPSGRVHYGGMVCGPVFRCIIESLLMREKKIIPSQCVRLARLEQPDVRQGSAPVSASSGQDNNICPSVIGLTLRDAARVLAKANILWQASGSGRVLRQSPRAYSPLDEARMCSLTLGMIE